MKKNFLKPLATGSIVALTLFSCAGGSEVSDNSGMEPTDVVVTETEVAGTTTPDGTVIVAETEVVADTTIMTQGTEQMANVISDDTYDDVDTDNYDILALLRMNPDLSTFTELVELSGLAPSLQMAGPVTVFAPTNSAFNEMPQEELASLVDEENRAELIKVINMHFIPSEVPSIAFQSNSFIDREEGEDIPVSVDMEGNQVYVGGAQIIKDDIGASNGILHVVNDIIEPTEEAGPGME